MRSIRRNQQAVFPDTPLLSTGQPTMKYTNLILNLIPEPEYLRQRATQFVEAISDRQFSPTLWGDDPPKTTFSAEGLLSIIREGQFPHSNFLRTTPPRWEGSFGYRKLKISFDSSLTHSDWGEIFRWSDRLAEILQPDFGTCHPLVVFEGGVNNNWGSLILSDSLEQYGLPWFGATTYLSHKLIDRIGMDRCLGAPAESITKVSWGIILKIVNAPWEVAPSEFVQRQTSLMEHLLPSGMFGRYADVLFKSKPGENWTPFSEG